MSEAWENAVNDLANRLEAEYHADVARNRVESDRSLEELRALGLPPEEYMRRFLEEGKRRIDILADLTSGRIRRFAAEVRRLDITYPESSEAEGDACAIDPEDQRRQDGRGPRVHIMPRQSCPICKGTGDKVKSDGSQVYCDCYYD